MPSFTWPNSCLFAFMQTPAEQELIARGEMSTWVIDKLGSYNVVEVGHCATSADLRVTTVNREAKQETDGAEALQKQQLTCGSQGGVLQVQCQDAGSSIPKQQIAVCSPKVSHVRAAMQIPTPFDYTNTTAEEVPPYMYGQDPSTGIWYMCPR